MASASAMPWTSGTSTFGPGRATTRDISSPGSTELPAAGAWDKTVPSGWLVVRSNWMSSSSPPVSASA